MALLGAGAQRLGLGPNRAFSGVTTIAGGYRRQNFELTGARLNWSAGEHAVSGQTDRAGVPNGARHPVAWLQPRKSGGLSAYVNAAATFALGPLNLSAGRNVAGDATFSWSVPDASLQLIVSASGTTSITWTPTGELAGALAAAGVASLTWNNPPATLGAIVDALGAASAVFSAAATPRAVGTLAGDITPFTELSPQTLAAAVWASVSRSLTAEVLADVRRVAGVAVDGAGTELDPWGPA